MKKVILSAVFGLMSFLASAQFQEVSVTDLQFVSAQDLANCNDTSQYFDDTVIVVGTAIHDGGLTELVSGSVTGGYRPGLWIVDTANNNAMAPFAAVQLHGVYSGNPVNQLDNIQAGWTIKVIGTVSRFDGETQFNPINNNLGSTAAGDAIEIISTTGAAPAAAPITDLGLLNDQNRENQLETGEQWEGSYIELYNLTVASVNFFSGGSRVSFDVVDGNGNTMNVSDRFIAQKLSSHSAVNAASPQTTGAFTVPPVGAQFDTLRGIVIHSQNGCTGDNGRGYELNPFDSNDYVFGATPPIISNDTRAPKFPTSADDVTVSAQITDFDGTVTTVELFYDLNGSGNYSAVTMTLVTGSTDEFEAQIPAQTDGTIVRYYIEATDNDGNMNTFPSTSPRQYTVRDNGLTIYDVQFVLDANAGDASPYQNDTVTVTGVVTASTKANDLGYVYIQQEGQTEWAGISLVGSSDLITLFRTEEVEVTGIVRENFGFTRIEVLSINKTGNQVEITPVVMDPSDATLHTDANLEKYESMLITLANPTASPMEIVNEDHGFGEYSFGNTAAAMEATRVLAGRQNSSSFSSLYVSLISDTFYINNQGEIEVDSIVVTEQGMQLDSLSGIMYYSFGNYKLLPRNNTDFVGLADASGAPIAVDSTIVPLPTPDDTTGIALVEGKSVAINMYPNPAAGVLNVQLSENVNGTIHILDFSGRTVLNTRIEGDLTRIATSNLVNGIYLVQITSATGEAISTEKLVIKQ